MNKRTLALAGFVALAAAVAIVAYVASGNSGGSTSNQANVSRNGGSVTATQPLRQFSGTGETGRPTGTPFSEPDKIKIALNEYAGALRIGNGDYVFNHLHPIATQFYGEATCREFFRGLRPDSTFSIVVNSIRGPESWTWQVFGQTIGTVPNAYTLNVRLMQGGNTVTADVHYAWDEQRGLLVFSPCASGPRT